MLVCSTSHTSKISHTQHRVFPSVQEGNKAKLPPKVTCAALREMNYKPLLEETPVLLFPSKFLNAASSNPGIQTLTQLCSLYFISNKSLTCPPPLGPNHRNNIPPKSKRQEKHPQTIPFPPLHFRPDVWHQSWSQRQNGSAPCTQSPSSHGYSHPKWNALFLH